MNMSSENTPYPSFDRIDDVCDHFESRWIKGSSPQIEQYLSQVAEEVHPILLQELLTVECEHLLEQGERPSFRIYKRRFAAHEPIVRQVFQSLQLMDLSSAAGTSVATMEAHSHPDLSFPPDTTSNNSPPQNTTFKNATSNHRETKASHNDFTVSQPTEVSQEIPVISGVPQKNPIISFDAFTTSIMQLQLMSHADLNEFVNQIPKQSRNTQMVAASLVEAGCLTLFQARMLSIGRGQELLLGQYLLLEELGQGGMGTVYKAQHLSLNRIVALKVLSARWSQDPHLTRRFRHEMNAASKLTHPNIVTTYDGGEANNVHYMVMEFVPGIDLDRLVMQHGPLTVEQALGYLMQAAHGLGYAHQAGIIHRDVKPANLLLSEQGQVKVLDMGLARIVSQEDLSESGRLTKTGQILGTAAFMAPEQALRVKEVDHRTDIYALGCSLYFLLTGDVPYRGDTELGTLYSHQESEIPSLSAINPNFPPWLEPIFLRMMAKNIEDRYPSMEAFCQDVEKLSGVSFGGPNPITVPPPRIFPANNSMTGQQTLVNGNSSTKFSQAGFDQNKMSVPLLVGVVGAAFLIGIIGLGIAQLMRPANPPTDNTQVAINESNTPTQNQHTEKSTINQNQSTASVNNSETESTTPGTSLQLPSTNSPTNQFPPNHFPHFQPNQFPTPDPRNEVTPNQTDEPPQPLDEPPKFTQEDFARPMPPNGPGNFGRPGPGSRPRRGEGPSGGGQKHKGPDPRYIKLEADIARFILADGGRVRLKLDPRQGNGLSTWYTKGMRIPPGQLNTIEIPGGKSVTDDTLKSIGQLYFLEHLDLSSTKITDEGLKHFQLLHHLQTLSLKNTAVTDRGIEPLKGSNQLQTLNVEGTQVTESGAKNLERSIRGLKVTR